MYPTAIAFAGFLVVLCVESLFSWLFLRSLQRDFPGLWEHSGRRTIWTDSNLRSAWPTIAYLWSRRYLERTDPAEVAFCERYRLPVVISYWSAAAAAITVAIVFLVFGLPTF